MLLVEFEISGSRHVHSFIWIINVSKLSSENIDENTKCRDGLLKANLPDPETDSVLQDLTNTYQIHWHSKSYRKYENDRYRIYFGRFFTKGAIIIH